MQRVTSVSVSGDDFLEGIARDEEGFLLSTDDWHPGLVDELAAEAGLQLTAEHRYVVQYIRDYFENNLSVPEARTLL